MPDPTRQQAQKPGSGKPCWFLVIDDDRMTGRALGRWVAHVTGCETRVARTIHQAECWLQLMASPLAVVSDFQLAGETGIQAVQRVHELGINCPIAIVTAAPDLAQKAVANTRSLQVPIFAKGELHEQFTAWLDALRPNLLRATA